MAQDVAAAIAEGCSADHATGSLRCGEPEHMCNQCVKVASVDILGSGTACAEDPPNPLCVLFQSRIPAGLPKSLSTYYKQQTLTGYTAGLARRVCMDFNACVDAPWMATAGASNAVADFMAEVEAYGSSFGTDLALLATLPQAQWQEEARNFLSRYGLRASVTHILYGAFGDHPYFEIHACFICTYIFNARSTDGHIYLRTHSTSTRSTFEYDARACARHGRVTVNDVDL